MVSEDCFVTCKAVGDRFRELFFAHPTNSIVSDDRILKVAGSGGSSVSRFGSSICIVHYS